MLVHPGSNTTRHFYSGNKLTTDFGTCCSISPFLNFVYEETKNVDPEDYYTKNWQIEKKGSTNGENGGLQFLLDVETFDFSYSGTDSHGFRIAFGNQRDKPIITQEGYLISTGKFFCCFHCWLKFLVISIFHTYIKS